MKVKDAMTPQVRMAKPYQPIWEAAQIMLVVDAGALPVGDDDRLVGMITDRDIAVRAVASRMSPDTKVSEVMTNQVLYCFDDEDVEDVADTMSEQKVRRLPVVDRDKHLVGIISLADLAQYDKIQAAGRATAEITQEYESLTEADIQACFLFATRALEDASFVPLEMEHA